MAKLNKKGGGLLNANLVYFVVLGVVMCVLLVWLFWPQAVVSKNGFGECLAENGVVMWGSDQCSKCLLQKDILGEDFNNVNYVNCDFNSQECLDKGISRYPVWSRDNDVLIGVQTLQTLSRFSGCEL